MSYEIGDPRRGFDGVEGIQTKADVPRDKAEVAPKHAAEPKAKRPANKQAPKLENK